MNQRGMTLVELLVVLVLASFIGFFVMNLFITSNRTFMDQNKVLDAQRDGRLVIKYLSRNLREAGLNPYGRKDASGKLLFRGIRGINSLADAAHPNAVSKIWFDRDFNINGSFDTDEMVVLELNPGTGVMKRTFSDMNGTPLRSQEIAKNIEWFEVDPRDAGGNSSLAAPEDTRTLIISISFKDTKNFGGEFTRTYSTRVDLRNL